MRRQRIDATPPTRQRSTVSQLAHARCSGARRARMSAEPGGFDHDDVLAQLCSPLSGHEFLRTVFEKEPRLFAQPSAAEAIRVANHASPGKLSPLAAV